MTQIERIQHMEAVLDEVRDGIAQLNTAVARYQDLHPTIQELAAYYGSPDWNQDLDDDRAGKLPDDLKRGVLSEDGVYDTLTDHRDILRQLLALVSAYIRSGDID
ncbi:MAG: DUF4298 domain-containing protein [Abditibacteriota bacterium]|nr:DUF4298 domain-containing protein [Abditibacteriota bacterium]